MELIRLRCQSKPLHRRESTYSGHRRTAAAGELLLYIVGGVKSPSISRRGTAVGYCVIADNSVLLAGRAPAVIA